MKLRSIRGGVNRVVAILLVLIAIMLVVVLLPAWDDLRLLSQRLSCEQAMKSAKDGLIIEYLGRFKEGSVQDAMNTLDQVMVARPNICPAGGEVYLINNREGIYEPLCGLHDRNARRRTRLNASSASPLRKSTPRRAPAPTPATRAIGVTETRLFTIGMPNSASISSPVRTRSPARRQILS